MDSAQAEPQLAAMLRQALALQQVDRVPRALALGQVAQDEMAGPVQRAQEVREPPAAEVLALQVQVLALQVQVLVLQVLVLQVLVLQVLVLQVLVLQVLVLQVLVLQVQVLLVLLVLVLQEQVEGQELRVSLRPGYSPAVAVEASARIRLHQRLVAVAMPEPVELEPRHQNHSPHLHGTSQHAAHCNPDNSMAPQDDAPHDRNFGI